VGDSLFPSFTRAVSTADRNDQTQEESEDEEESNIINRKEKLDVIKKNLRK